MTARAPMGWSSTLLTGVALVAVVVVAAVLGQRAPDTASIGTETAASSATPALMPFPTPVGTPSPAPLGLTYACGGASFSPALFNEPELDLRSIPAGVALAEFIESGQAGEVILPPDGFRLAGEDDSNAWFVAPLPGDPPYAHAHLEKDAGGWRVSGWGQCRPQIALQGAGAATWSLPEDEAVNRSTTTFTALVTEGTCTGGSSSEGRVREPLIIYEQDRVVVIFTVDPLPPGTYTCPGNPPTRVRVELSEALGERQLLDGGTFPFGDPTLNPWER